MTLVSLSEVAKINPRGPAPGCLDPDSACDFVPMADVHSDGTMRPTEQRRYSELMKGFTAFQNDDVLVAKITPCFENNKIALAQTATAYGFGSTEFHVVRSHPEKLCPKYLTYFLRRDETRFYGEQRMTGSAGQRRVPKAFLEEVQIPLPPLDEQHRIAAILDKADAIRRKREQALALADELLKSTFLDMFGDPVTNPKGWSIRQLGEIGQLDRGKSQHRPRNDPKLLGGPYPLIQTGDVARSGRFVLSHSSSYSEFGLQQSRMWPKGTLCITIAANIADTAILSFDACFPDSVVGFAPHDGIQSEFVRVWFSFLKDTIAAKAPQVAQKNINLRILRELPVAVPPPHAQEKFAGFSDALSRYLDNTRSALEQADKLFASLSQRAFRGKL